MIIIALSESGVTFSMCFPWEEKLINSQQGLLEMPTHEFHVECSVSPMFRHGRRIDCLYLPSRFPFPGIRTTFLGLRKVTSPIFGAK